MKKNLLLLFILFCSIVSESLATVSSTTAVSSITSTSGQSGGTIPSTVTNDWIIEAGIVWSTSINPTTASSKNSITYTYGTQYYPLTVSGLIMSSLSSSTLYHVRAFVISGPGAGTTEYGPDITFTTSAGIPPSVTTTTASSITGNGAASGGTPSNASPVSEGVVWGTALNPTMPSANSTSNGTSSTAYSSTITGLLATTTYHYRAYIEQPASTYTYGSDLTFTTTTPTIANVTANSVTANTAASGGTPGNITSAISKGVVWATTANPTIANSFTSDGTSSAAYTSSLTGLSPGTLYHYRSYVQTSTGVYIYGTDLNFTTLLPSVTTTTATAVTGNGAASGGTPSNVTSTTAQGVVWGTALNPTMPSSNSTTDGTTGSVYTSTISGLAASTLYHYRAYINIGGTYYYGNDLIITTTIPSVASVTATAVTGNGASSGGTPSNITSAISEGVVWGAALNPTMPSANSTSDGTSVSAYSSSLTGLSPATLYHYRAYIQTSTGVYYYGLDNTFTTLTPSVTTTVATGVIGTGASSGGTPSNITSATAEGVVWGAALNPTMPSANSTSNGTSASAYTSSITGLTVSTTYHYRAYILVSGTYYYGADNTFTTLAGVPSVTTTTATGIASNGATSGGTPSNVSSTTAQGVVWGAALNPTMPSGNSTSNGTTGSAYSSTISGLTVATTYHYRAYILVSGTYYYGADNTFTTTSGVAGSSIAPTAPIINIAGSTATSSGNSVTTWAGGGGPAKVGLVWSTGAINTSTDPTAQTNYTLYAYASGGAGTFPSSVETIGTGATAHEAALACGTTYNVMAYARDNYYPNTWMYSTNQTFTSAKIVITTTAITQTSNSTGTSGGNITSTCGGVTVVTRGVCYSNSTNPTTANSTLVNGSAGTGVYTSNLTGLLPNSTYYLKAYAIGSDGITYYGAQVSIKLNFTPVTGAISPYSISPKWMFSYKTGLNFNTGAPDGASFKVSDPVFLSGNPTIDSNYVSGSTAAICPSTEIFTHDLEEGSTICDSADNIALYCNSTQIFDKTHTAITNMLNNKSGYNSISSTDGSIILPDPVNPFNIYHFFLANDHSSGQCFQNKGVIYYKINKSGAVISGPILLDSTNYSGNDSDESIYTSSDSVGGYWIVTRSQNNGDFLKWHLKNDGTLQSLIAVHIPASSRTGGAQAGIKINQCQNKLAWTGGGPIVEVYQWIKSKGTIGSTLYSGSVPSGQYATNPLGAAGYGLEFSPDGTKLYQSSLGYAYSSPTDGTLNQLDLNTNTWGSSTVYTGSINGGHEIGTMQIGPNGKIYVAMKSDNTVTANSLAFYVGSIDNPNVAQGSGLVFTPTAVKIKNANSGSKYPAIGRGVANIPWLNPKTQAATSIKVNGGCRRYRLTTGAFSYFRDTVSMISATWYITDNTAGGTVILNGSSPFNTIVYDFPADDSYSVYCVTQDATCGELRTSNTFNVTPNCALPVEFLNIAAASQPGVTKLIWSTAMERNSSSFSVQRSVDGKNFQTIGTLAASGNSRSVKNYTYLDKEPLAGTVYYRVIENDDDGEKIFSAIVSTASQTDSKLYTISNNPFKNEFSLNMIGEKDIRIDIYEASGKLVYTNRIESASGSIGLGAGLSPGAYILEVIDNETGKAYRDKVLKY